MLVPGLSWLRNDEKFPGYLTLLGVNAGQGFATVGPMNSGKGKDIATVFERPDVYSSRTILLKSQTLELHITGIGFTNRLSQTQLKFDPPLSEGNDYSLKVINRTNLEITLVDGKKWRKDSGPLIMKAINTRGDDGGWVNLDEPNGVHVAEVVEDKDVETVSTNIPASEKIEISSSLQHSEVYSYTIFLYISIFLILILLAAFAIIAITIYKQQLQIETYPSQSETQTLYQNNSNNAYESLPPAP